MFSLVHSILRVHPFFDRYAEEVAHVVRKVSHRFALSALMSKMLIVVLFLFVMICAVCTCAPVLCVVCSHVHDVYCVIVRSLVESADTRCSLAGA